TRSPGYFCPAPLLGRWPVEDRLDVVAVGVAHEGTEVAGVVLRPLARRMKLLRPKTEGRLVEGPDLLLAPSPEGQVPLAAAALRGTVAEPEVGILRPVAHGHAVVNEAPDTQRRQDGVVERGAHCQVGTVDAEVVDNPSH